MSEWRELKLNEIAGLRREGFKPDQLHNLPYIGLEHIEAKGLRLNSIGNSTEVTSQKSKFFPNDILYGKLRPYFQKVYNPSFEGVCSTDIFVIKAKKEIDSKFLFYLIASDEFTNLANNGSTGTRMPRADWKHLSSTFWNIPDLPTQKAIAEILSSLDDKIELNNQINQNLEALAQALFKQWFVDFEFPNENGEPYKSSGGEMIDSELGEIPKGWRVGMLEEVIEFSNGYSFKSSELLDDDLGNCFHVFKMGHIKKGGGLNAEGTKSYFEKEKTSKLGKYVLKIGDLLMCMTDMKGNVALLGHTALMNEDEKYIVNQRVGLLRPRNSVGIDYPYLYILTNSTLFIEDLRSRANSGVQVNLSTSEIRNTKIIIPDFQTNSAFDKAVKPFFLRLFNSQKENHSLRTLRDTLLPKLISGELEINESLLEPTF
jgi:type I restriction enzyme S subunit